MSDITELHTLQFTVSQYNAKNHIGQLHFLSELLFAEKTNELSVLKHTQVQ